MSDASDSRPGPSPGLFRAQSREVSGDYASQLGPYGVNGRVVIVGDTPRLCHVVQGVEFSVVEQGVRIRALILRDALEAFFGADESPASWLSAYERNRDAIDCAAADRFRSKRSAGFVILRAQNAQDFDFVERSCGVR